MKATYLHITMDNIIYIVGGGLSLEGYDFSLLDDRRVIAVNASYEYLPNAEIVYSSDSRFFDIFDHDVPLILHTGRKATIDNKTKFPGTEVYKNTGRAGLELTPGCLRNGNNSVYAAINLAAHEGARTIVLMGVDMKCSTTKTHYHGGHSVEGKKVHMHPRVFNKMIKYFSTLTYPLSMIGIEVFNAVGEEGSDLKSFPTIDLKDVHLLRERRYESARYDKG